MQSVFDKQLKNLFDINLQLITYPMLQSLLSCELTNDTDRGWLRQKEVNDFDVYGHSSNLESGIKFSRPKLIIFWWDKRKG